MRCAVYARFSTDKQDMLSIETQLMMCRREIERQGWSEVACFTDAAESAATLHRPGMQALLATIQAGYIDIVYADAMDRLSRSQADIASLFERLRFRGIILATRKEGVVTPLHIGMMGTINAEQLSATSEKTRDALVRRQAMGRNPGGSAYGYETRVAYDGNGERIRGLQQIVPAEAAVVVRIYEDYAAGLSPIAIARRLNAEGIPSPRGGRPGKGRINLAAWTPNTLTGNAARGTGILNNQLYIGQRPYGKQTYRKNPDTGKRHAFINAADAATALVRAPDLRIVPDALWGAVKARQAALARPPRTEPAGPARPYFAQQRPKYLLTGKMTCGVCGASYAKSGQHRFGCQGAAKKGPTWCDNRLTIRQDALDARVLKGLTTAMLRDDVVAAFLEEYAAETHRLEEASVSTRPEHEAELSEVDQQISHAKTAILKGVDPSLFVDELQRLGTRRTVLIEALAAAEHPDAAESLLRPDLGRIYCEKVTTLTSAYEDDALRAQAFERIRALIETVVLTPQGEDLAIELRGELASMLELSASTDMQNASEAVASEALQMK
ncbi:Site-specific DNA recombinase, partial [Sphingomonas carotinifaciens]